MIYLNQREIKSGKLYTDKGKPSRICFFSQRMRRDPEEAQIKWFYPGCENRGRSANRTEKVPEQNSAEKNRSKYLLRGKTIEPKAIMPWQSVAENRVIFCERLPQACF